MSFCQTCGSNLPDGSAHCPACGAPQGVAAPAAAPAAGPGVAPGYTQYPTSAPAPGYAQYPVAPAPVATTGGGLTPNVAGALAYLVGAITGILFLVIDPFKTDRFVRFHAFQSIFFNLAWIAFWIVWTILGITLGAITHGLFFIIQIPVNLLIGVGGLCLWIYMMYTAYQGKTFRIPVIGALAAKQAGI